MHRAVILGNFVGLKALLESSILYGSLNERTNTLLRGIGREIREAVCIDVFAQDAFGKSARDYAHKIVFMSKLLCRAERRQVKDRFDGQAESHLDSHGLVGGLPTINHDCLSTVFIRKQKVNRLKYSSFWKQRRQASLIDGAAGNDRMAVSFA